MQPSFWIVVLIKDFTTAKSRLASALEPRRRRGLADDLWGLEPEDFGTDDAAGSFSIAAGESVMTLLGAANRDPRRFTEPETLDVSRDEGPPMSFGSGIHYCLGAALARLEGQVCFGRMLERFHTIELSNDEISYRDTITLRGLTELPVVLLPD